MRVDVLQREGERAKPFRLWGMSVHVLPQVQSHLGSASSLLLAKGNQGKPKPATGRKVQHKSLKFQLQFRRTVQRIISKISHEGSMKNRR